MDSPLLVWMPAKVRDSWNRALQSLKTYPKLPPDLLLPISTGSSARHQSRPSAVFVRSIPGQLAHIIPVNIPPHDRDIYLKCCPDTNPFLTLEAATPQHANTLTSLKTRRLRVRNPNSNNK
eukprot:scaffold43397_cov19-Tisochrysis_lutea.AAC.1